jgi:hypothetical protein
MFPSDTPERFMNSEPPGNEPWDIFPKFPLTTGLYHVHGTPRPNLCPGLLQLVLKSYLTSRVVAISRK